MKTTRAYELEFEVDVELDIEDVDDDDGLPDPRETGNHMTGYRGSARVPVACRVVNVEALLERLAAAALERAKEDEWEEGE